MAQAREQKTKAPAKRDDEQESPQAVVEDQEVKDQRNEDIDAILDDIDEALEANAAQFVRAYVQKGGQ